MGKISITQVKHVAELANLKISQKEVVQIKRQLDQTFIYVDKLNDIDIENIPPTSHVTGLYNIYRTDGIKPSLKSQEVISSNVATYNNYFLVKSVLNKE